MDLIQEPCAEASMRAGHADAVCSRAARPWLLAATILGSSLAFIDGSVANLALPALQLEFAASIADLQWVIEAYALFLAALLLVGGALGDRYGRKRIYAAGVALFALASLGCGAASSMQMLIIARSVQGVGAALLVPGSLPRNQRSARQACRHHASRKRGSADQSAGAAGGPGFLCHGVSPGHAGGRRTGTAQRVERVAADRTANMNCGAGSDVPGRDGRR